ncbi:MAG TPA: GIY-YIG nuclease family protein [Pyrinomonadaceae bacterium]|nr:GIY-YIG nuclease family protein [Pyrinomonadaceae bacterium]
MRQYYVYIMASRSRTLYTGVTNDLERRVFEHKEKLVPGFTTKYRIERLVYFEITEDVHSAIAREKQIKGWTRDKKVALIDSLNPTWKDLSAGWFERKTMPT